LHVQVCNSALQDKLNPLSAFKALAGMEALKSMAVACLNWDAGSRPHPADIVNQVSLNQAMATSPHLRSNDFSPAASISNSSGQAERVPAATSPVGSATGNLLEQQQKGPNAATEKTVEMSDGNAATLQVSQPDVAQGGPPSIGDENDTPRSRQPASSPRMCAENGCGKKTVKKYGASYCWDHIDQSFPDELKLTQALAAGGILHESLPCDLIAALLYTNPQTPLIVAALIYFLKIPAAIEKFAMALPPTGSTIDAPALHDALQAAF
jgi:hypothetical protein